MDVEYVVSAGPEHREVAIVLTNLGNAYGALGDYVQQRVLLERSLKMKERQTMYMAIYVHIWTYVWSYIWPYMTH